MDIGTWVGLAFIIFVGWKVSQFNTEIGALSRRVSELEKRLERKN